MIINPNRQYITRHGWTTITIVKVIPNATHGVIDTRFPYFVQLISDAGKLMRQWYTAEGRWFGKPGPKRKQIDSEWDLVQELKP